MWNNNTLFTHSVTRVFLLHGTYEFAKLGAQSKVSFFYQTGFVILLTAAWAQDVQFDLVESLKIAV